jgi:hypothetical protein
MGVTYAVLSLVVGASLTIAGLTWILGPLVLVGAGVALTGCGLLLDFGGDE